MRKSRFSDEQIVGILKEHAAGERDGHACAGGTASASRPSIAGKHKYDGLEGQRPQTAEGAGRGERPAQAPGRRASPGQPGPQGTPPKKLVRPAQRRAAVGYVQERFGFSQRRACRLVGAARSTVRYQRPARTMTTPLRRGCGELAAQRPRFGYRRLHVLLRREGIVVNHKRVERLYREEGLAVRRRTRKSLTRDPARSPTRPAAAPTSSGRWISCRMRWPRGATIRLLSVIDVFTREALALEVDTSLPGQPGGARPGSPARRAGAARRSSCWTTGPN